MIDLIEIEVEYDSGKSLKKSMHLHSKLQEVGIDPSQLEETYKASYISNTPNDPKIGINQIFRKKESNICITLSVTGYCCN